MLNKHDPHRAGQRCQWDRNKMVNLNARVTLRDAEEAINLFKNNCGSEHWRIYLVAAFTVLRMVGDVLAKIDTHDGRVKTEFERVWKSWRKEKICKNFLKIEGNLVVQFYKFPYEHEFISVGEGGILGTEAGVAMVTGNLYIESGVFAGHSFIDLLDQAAAWWDEKLTEIEKSVS